MIDGRAIHTSRKNLFLKPEATRIWPGSVRKIQLPVAKLGIQTIKRAKDGGRFCTGKGQVSRSGRYGVSGMFACVTSSRNAASDSPANNTHAIDCHRNRPDLAIFRHRNTGIDHYHRNGWRLAFPVTERQVSTFEMLFSPIIKSYTRLKHVIFKIRHFQPSGKKRPCTQLNLKKKTKQVRCGFWCGSFGSINRFLATGKDWWPLFDRSRFPITCFGLYEVFIPLLPWCLRTT